MKEFYSVHNDSINSGLPTCTMVRRRYLERILRDGTSSVNGRIGSTDCTHLGYNRGLVTSQRGSRL